MKKIFLIISIILALFLVGCGDKEVITTDEKLDTEIVEQYLEQYELWENTELLDTSYGFYIPGFSFFDIDLDGEKELAVQYSGGTMRNCTTKFYELKGDEVIEVYATNPELNISLAIGNLKKYTDLDGREFYINMNTFKTDATVYNTYIDELMIIDGVPDLIHLYSYIETYEDEENSNVVYYIGDTEVTKEEYDKSMNDYLKFLTQEEVKFEFIPYEDWKSYTEEQKREALLKALNA